jgi:hypothetical protein
MKVICDNWQHCKETCEHREPHLIIDREPINLMHSNGCHENPRHDCNGQCKPYETFICPWCGLEKSTDVRCAKGYCRSCSRSDY